MNLIGKVMDREGLLRDLASVLNKHSAENGSNTPDFVLASYLVACLEAFDAHANWSDRWHGIGEELTGCERFTPGRLEEG